MSVLILSNYLILKMVLKVVAVNSYIKNSSRIYLVKAKTNYGFSKHVMLVHFLLRN
ncbi:Uncharacterised protein [Escherichia coli]|nr:Uncharacterised protein [Escherichia coli]